MAANPYQQYQTTQVKTASTGDLVLLLYDGAIRFLARAELAIGEHRLDAAGADIVRGQDIVLELMSGLEMEQGGELAANLRDLYLYMYQTLVKANLRKDVEQVRLVVRLLDRVRGAWRTVIRGEAATAAGVGLSVAGGRAA